VAKVIHFTHHLCRTVDPRAEHPYAGLSATADERREYERRFGAGEQPKWTSRCVFGKAPRFTVERKLVTCRSCLRTMGRPYDVTGKDKDVTDTTLVQRAWLLCCSKRDAPCPLSRAELAAAEVDRRRRSIEELTKLEIHLMVGATNGGIAEHLRAVASRVAIHLDDDIREAARPLINEWLIAADLAEVIDERLASAKVLAAALRGSLRPNSAGAMSGAA
jgi:hypothetical protein